MINRRDIQNVESLFMLSIINECRSKRKAAEAIGASVDTINKYISNLEAELGLKLVESSEQGCVLTPMGQNILKNIQQMKELLLKIYEEKQQKDNMVKIGMDTGISTALVFYDIDKFFCRFPNIKIQSVIWQDHPKLASANFDIGISYNQPTEKEIVILDCKKVTCKLFAGEKYIQKYGFPSSVADLVNNHRIICDKSPLCGNSIYPDIFQQAKNICYLSGSLTEAIRHNIGICMLPVCLAEKGMVCLDNFDWQSTLGLYLFSYQKVKDRQCVRAVIDHFKEIFSCLH